MAEGVPGHCEALVRAEQDRVQAELWRLRGNPKATLGRVRALEWWQARLRRCAADARAIDEETAEKITTVAEVKP